LSLSYSLATKKSPSDRSIASIGSAIGRNTRCRRSFVVVNHRDSATQAAEVVAAIERAGGRAASIQRHGKIANTGASNSRTD